MSMPQMLHASRITALLLCSFSGCKADQTNRNTNVVDTGDDISVIPYTGGWPTNPQKDDIEDPGWTTTATVGAPVPRFIGVDQYGDSVDLYDFAGRGVPIVIDMGTIYCEPCKAIAAYLSTGDMDHLVWDPPEGAEPGYYPWWKEEYAELPQMIANQEIYWLTILFNESNDGPSDQEECALWHEAYPNPDIPVLADTNLELKTWLDIQSYPTLNLVDEHMVLQIHSSAGPYDVMRHLGEMMANRD